MRNCIDAPIPKLVVMLCGNSPTGTTFRNEYLPKIPNPNSVETLGCRLARALFTVLRAEPERTRSTSELVLPCAETVAQDSTNMAIADKIKNLHFIFTPKIAIIFENTSPNSENNSFSPVHFAIAPKINYICCIINSFIL